MEKYNILVIGGGIVGCAINYELSKYDLDILQVEKRNYFANETTTGNSGILHGGFDAKPGKNTALYNVRGLKLWVDKIFPHLGFPRKQINSLVIAFNESEHEGVLELYERGKQNKVDMNHIKVIDKVQIKKLEPNIDDSAYSALLCTNSWAIDPVKAAHAFLGSAQQNGSTLKSFTKVTKIQKDGSDFLVTLNDKEVIKTNYIINAAGHFADKISKMANGQEMELTTKRGQYIVLSETENSKVNNICFKMPNIRGKGVVVAPMLDGRVLIGPTAKDTVPKEETRVLEKDIWNEIENIGKDIIKNMDFSKVERIFAGSRPICAKTNDFIIGNDEKIKGLIHCAGMKSPGLTSSPAIAEKVVKLLKSSGLTLKLKDDYIKTFKVL